MTDTLISNIGDYLSSIFLEGLLFALLFWVVGYITVERSSLWIAIRASLLAEVIANLPYLAGVPASTPPGILMTLVGAVIFVRLVVRAGELSLGQTSYATLTSYFILVAVVACQA